MYYIYMIRCKDDSLYTGITNNLEKRMSEHFNKEKNCAKYTLSHDAKRIDAVWETEDRKLASKMEFHVKRLIKKEKEELIKSENMENYLGNKLECNLYKKLTKREIEKLLKKDKE